MAFNNIFLLLPLALQPFVGFSFHKFVPDFSVYYILYPSVILMIFMSPNNHPSIHPRFLRFHFSLLFQWFPTCNTFHLSFIIHPHDVSHHLHFCAFINQYLLRSSVLKFIVCSYSPIFLFCPKLTLDISQNSSFPYPR